MRRLRSGTHPDPRAGLQSLRDRSASAGRVSMLPVPPAQTGTKVAVGAKIQKGTTMPKKKPSSKIGPGKAGSGKRMLYKAGGTKRELKQWRGLSRSTRQRVKATARRVNRAGGSYDIRQTLRNIRSR